MKMTNDEDRHEERWNFSIFSGTRKVWRGQIANSSAAFAFQPYVLRGALFDLDPRSKFSHKGMTDELWFTSENFVHPTELLPFHLRSKREVRRGRVP